MGVNSDGSIPCPPKGVGVPGDSVLEHMSLLEENFISNLLEEANLVQWYVTEIGL
jgi:hypothetical protein